eukprot:362125-Karenia_brevis.AAC.1
MYQQLDYQLPQGEMLRVTMTLQRQQNVLQQLAEKQWLDAFQGVQVQENCHRGKSMMLLMRALPRLNKKL